MLTLLALLVLLRYAWWSAVLGPFVLAVGTLVVFRAGAWLVVPERWRSRTRTGGLAAGAAVVGLGAVAGWLVLAVILAALVGVLGMTQEERYRARVRAVLTHRVSSGAGIDSEEIRVANERWDGRRLVTAEIRCEAPADTYHRDRLAALIAESLRDTGVSYEVSWSAQRPVFVMRAMSALPTGVHDRRWSGACRAVPLGVTNEDAIGEAGAERAAGASEPRLPVCAWNPERNLLVVGEATKTGFKRGLCARAMRLGFFPGGMYVLDGASSGAYAMLSGRHGIRAVARAPRDWATALQHLTSIVESRHGDNVEYRSGRCSTEPDHPALCVVLEEPRRMRALLGGRFDRFCSRLARHCRETNVRLVLVTRRADSEEAIPNAVRDLLDDAVVMGPVSRSGAEPVLGRDWSSATDVYGAVWPPGRGVARLGGRIGHFQAFLLDRPRDLPAAEYLYPPPKGSPRLVIPPTATSTADPGRHRRSSRSPTPSGYPVPRETGKR